jgi:ankyrin repeat protein
LDAFGGHIALVCCLLVYYFAMSQDSKHVYELVSSDEDKSAELKEFLEAHPGVDVNLHQSRKGWRATHLAVIRDRAECLQLLVDAKADLEARDAVGRTALLCGSEWGRLRCLQVLMESKADVQTADRRGHTTAIQATKYGPPRCLQALIDAKADVNAQDTDISLSPAMYACTQDSLEFLQMLVDAKADLNATSDNGGTNVLSNAMYIFAENERYDGKQRAPGIPFAVLSCDTDSKNEANIDEDLNLSQATVNAYINEYKQIHDFIDNYHTVINHALSDDVVVDTRVGRGDYGLYHEPLEQVLLYLGMSMHKDQTVTTSIDGKTVKRALIPGHPTNANLWYELYQRTLLQLKLQRPISRAQEVCVPRYTLL